VKTFVEMLQSLDAAQTTSVGVSAGDEIIDTESKPLAEPATRLLQGKPDKWAGIMYGTTTLAGRHAVPNCELDSCPQPHFIQSAFRFDAPKGYPLARLMIRADGSEWLEEVGS